MSSALCLNESLDKSNFVHLIEFPLTEGAWLQSRLLFARTHAAR